MITSTSGENAFSSALGLCPLRGFHQLQFATIE